MEAEAVNRYEGFHRKQLVKAIKHFKKNSEMFRSKSDGFGKNLNGNGLKRPVIENEHYSWAAFSKLPKEVIIVYGYMIGCDINYIEKLKEKDFFVPERLKEE
tara:strand:- start:357 stop:662 length:306 start_codon:yes stop_codon:yes gene_type:complete